MNQIGFKNFRKFENFPVMDFSPITIFVGENNAGKSTVVKAILSTLDFLNSQYFQIEKDENDKAVLNHRFYFNKSFFAHIGTFSRALYNKSIDDIITFVVTESNIKFEIEIKGNKNDEESISGNIQKIKMNILKWNIDLNFDFINDDIHAVFHKETNALYREDRNNDYIRIRFGEKKESLTDYFASVPDNAELHVPITGRTGMIGGSLIGWLLDRFTYRIDELITDKPKDSSVNKTKIREISSEMKCFLEKNKKLLGKYGALDFIYPFYSSNIEYIYAHAVTQTVIYSAKDTNDYLVKTIHEFANCRITEGSKIHRFITKWMKTFNIGTNYEISSVGGEAHIVKIIEKDGCSVNLADKGMGSIQLMVLLFRLATRMADRVRPTIGRASTIIIEEPEQNLHPMLQSKLAVLFYEMNRKYGYRFIIETHSEYLIRKTQVIVKQDYNDVKNALKDNPFKVYYFNTNSKKPYYEIKYQKDGNFANDFGKGFFDEASNLAFEIL
ncbi:MAG: AAA family ATPase [Bacteroidales bacterium]|nr:AAA family ATPase [Bacteroidales bacterium]